MYIKTFDKIGNQLSECQFKGTLLDYIKKEAGNNYSDSLQGVVYSATVNGEYVPNSEHDLVNCGDVEITIEPRDPFTAAVIIFGVISAGYAYYTYKQIPKGYQDTQQQQEQGSSIYTTRLRTNRARPNQPIREVSGVVPIFPDLICPIHRRYENNEEIVYLMLSVGVGYFDRPEAFAKIADTAISNYSSDITIESFEPGQDVSGNEAHEIWYQAEDAGDIELKSAPETPTGSWSAIFTNPNQIQSFQSGTATAFPFDVDALFTISDANTAANELTYRVSSLGTTTTTNDTATVVKQDFNGSIYSDGTTNITSDSLNSVDWATVSGGPNYEGVFTACPDGEIALEMEVDLLCPEGMVRYDSDGNALVRSVAYQIQYRQVGGNWTTYNGSIQGSSPDQFGQTITFTGLSYQPQVRIRRVTEDSNSTQIRDRLDLVRVKTRLASPASYSDVTTMAVRIRGTNALSTNAENKISISGSARKLPTLSELEANLRSGTTYDLSESATQAVGDAFDVENATLSNTTFLENIWSNFNPDSFFIADNGQHIYFTEVIGSNREFYRYTLTTAYDMRTIDLSSFVVHSITNVAGQYTQMFDSGTKVLQETSAGNTNVFYLSTAYDITTISTSPDDVFSDSGYGGQWAWINGNKLYKSEVLTVRQYSITGNDITSGSYDSVEESLSGVTSATRFYVFDDYFFGLGLHKYSKSASTIDSMTYLNESFADAGNVSYVNFKPDGTEMYAFDGDEGINTYQTQVITNTRTTASPGRFVAHMFASRIGSSVADFIDWTALSNLDTTLNTRGDELNAEFSDQTTLWEAAKIALAPGYSEPTIKNGVLTPVRNVAGTDYTQLYTPDVILGDGVATVAEHDIDEEPDGIIVEYINNLTGITETVDCFLAGDQGIRAQRIQAIGITDRTRAWRYGMRERLRRRLRPQELKFTTEMDALNSFYGDAIGVVDETIAPHFGKLLTYSAPTVTVDQDLTFGSGTHYACFRTDEGVFSGLYEVQAGVSANELTLISPATLDFIPKNTVYFSFGTLSELVQRCIVRDIQPSDDGIIDVICEEYLEDIYQNDDGSP